MRFSSDVLAAPAEVLGGRAVGPGADPRVWFWALAGATTDTGRGKHSLHFGDGTAIVRTTSRAHLVRALARNLAATAHALHDPHHTEQVHLRVLTFVRASGAVLLDPALASLYDAALPAAARHGWNGGDLYLSSIDPDRLELVMPSTAAVGADDAALRALGPPGRAEPPVGPSRLPIIALLVPATSADVTGSTARLLRRAGFPWRPPARDAVDAVSVLARIRRVSIDSTARDVVAALTTGHLDR